MGRHWYLGEIDEAPQVPLPETFGGPQERHRLMREAARRMPEGPGRARCEAPLSRVERAMRRNAPDLAGAPVAEVMAARARRFAHRHARWPRPRLLALIGLMSGAAWMPDVALRMAVWAVILLLVASVACGPERARDGARFIGRRFLRLWRHEIAAAQRLAGRGRPRAG